MNTQKKENNKLFLVCPVIADLRRRKLLLTKGTLKHLNNLSRYSTIIYFQYKKRYPDFEEEIIPNTEPIPLNKKYVEERRKGYEPIRLSATL